MPDDKVRSLLILIHIRLFLKEEFSHCGVFFFLFQVFKNHVSDPIRRGEHSDLSSYFIQLSLVYTPPVGGATIRPQESMKYENNPNIHLHLPPQSQKFLFPGLSMLFWQFLYGCSFWGAAIDKSQKNKIIKLSKLDQINTIIETPPCSPRDKLSHERRCIAHWLNLPSPPRH